MLRCCSDPEGERYPLAFAVGKQNRQRFGAAHYDCELRISELTIPIKSGISTVLVNSEKLMAISISKWTVSTKAPVGTTIGALTVQDASGAVLVGEYTLTKNSAGFFAVSGNNLVTQRGSIPVGNYSVRLHAVAANSRFSGNAYFLIAVTP